MGAGASVIVMLGIGVPADVVARERPQLVPHGITTRMIADTDVARAHRTHLKTTAYEIDTVCDGSYCVEQLRAGGHVLISAVAALAALQREVTEPGHEGEVDATEIVVPQPSAPGFLSVYRLESNYAAGAAHANGSGHCETYAIATGKRVTLRDVVGAKAAKRIAKAARAADDTGGYLPGTTELLIPAAGTVDLCGDADYIGPAHDPITLTVRTR